MRIIHAGVFNDHALGGDLIFEKGLQLNGCRVTRFDFREHARRDGLEAMRTGLVDASRNQDAVLIGKGELLCAGTLKQIRALGVQVWLWYGDIRPDPEPWLIDLLPFVDVYFMSSGGGVLREHFTSGRPGRACFFTHPIDPDVVSAHEDLPRGTRNVVFTGTGYSFAGPERRITIEYLKSRPDAAVFGGAHDHRTFRGVLRRVARRLGPAASDHLRGRDYVAAIRSARIGIGVSAVNDVPKYTSDRLSHYLGFGTFYLCWRFEGVDELFTEGKDLQCFSSVEELETNLERYLQDHDEREAIAAQGQKRMLDEYNCENVVGMMLEVARGGRSDRFPWVEVLQ